MGYNFNNKFVTVGSSPNNYATTAIFSGNYLSSDNGKTYNNSYNVDNNVIVASKDKKYGVIKLTNGETVLDFKYDKV